MTDKSDVFGQVHRWREGDILRASNDWISMAYVVTEDPAKVGDLGFYGPDEICVLYIEPEKAALWNGL